MRALRPTSREPSAVAVCNVEAPGPKLIFRSRSPCCSRILVLRRSSSCLYRVLASIAGLELVELLFPQQLGYRSLHDKPRHTWASISSHSDHLRSSQYHGGPTRAAKSGTSQQTHRLRSKSWRIQSIASRRAAESPRPLVARRNDRYKPSTRPRVTNCVALERAGGRASRDARGRARAGAAKGQGAVLDDAPASRAMPVTRASVEVQREGVVERGRSRTRSWLTQLRIEQDADDDSD